MRTGRQKTDNGRIGIRGWFEQRQIFHQHGSCGRSVRLPKLSTRGRRIVSFEEQLSVRLNQFARIGTTCSWNNILDQICSQLASVTGPELLPIAAIRSEVQVAVELGQVARGTPEVPTLNIFNNSGCPRSAIGLPQFIARRCIGCGEENGARSHCQIIDLAKLRKLNGVGQCPA